MKDGHRQPHGQLLPDEGAWASRRVADEILDGGISPLHAERANKCYMADTGLLVESAVAQTLVAKGDRLFFYTQSGLEEGKERMEIDFLVTRPFRDAALKPRSAQSR